MICVDYQGNIMTMIKDDFLISIRFLVKENSEYTIVKICQEEHPNGYRIRNRPIVFTRDESR